MRSQYYWCHVPLILILASLWSLTTAQEYQACRDRISSWHDEELKKLESQEVQHQLGSTVSPALKNLLFFLHIPRTGGRTYHQCFLKVLFPPQERCPRSYDTLRLDPNKPQCRLLSTHNDYSLMSRLPAQATSVITNVRDPVDRLLSAYEFMVELAARHLRFTVDGNGTEMNMDAILAARRQNSSNAKRTETRSVWPWNYLVPLMEDDLWQRRMQGRAAYGKDNGSYDSPRLIMPLREFAHHPMVQDLILDGGTMQVAGLTNNSYHSEANFLRTCARSHEDLGKMVLEVAKARLDRMLYVGLTEAHGDSARLFAHVIGRPLSSPAHVLNLPRRVSQAVSPQLVEEKFRRAGRLQEGRWLKERKRLERMQAAKIGGISLLQHYDRCVNQQRGKYAIRKQQALKPLYVVHFSKEERQKISQGLIDDIRGMNKLDMELLEHARGIFKREQTLHGKKTDGAEQVTLVSAARSDEAKVQEQLKALSAVEKSLNTEVASVVGLEHHEEEHPMDESTKANVQLQAVAGEEKAEWERMRLEREVQEAKGEKEGKEEEEKEKKDQVQGEVDGPKVEEGSGGEGGGGKVNGAIINGGHSGMVHPTVGLYGEEEKVSMLKKTSLWSWIIGPSSAGVWGALFACTLTFAILRSRSRGSGKRRGQQTRHTA